MTTRKTITQLLHDQAERYGDRVSHYHWERGQWRSMTWRQLRQVSREVAFGLWSLGCRKGDKVGLISETRWEWTCIDSGCLAFGAVVVGIYPTSTPEQVAYILEHSEAKVVFVENAAQLAKLNELRDRLPALQAVVVMDPPDGGKPEGWLTLDGLREKGRALEGQEPALLDRAREAVLPEDVATLVYTSGTTGPPKGVVCTHRAFFDIADLSVRHLGMGDEDVSVVFLPLAHSLQRVSLYSGVRAGMTGYYAPSLDRLMETVQAAQPTTMASVPRIFEKVHSRIVTGLAQQPERRRKLFAAAMKVGRARSRFLQEKRPVPLHLRVGYALFDRVVFSKLRARLFGPRLRFLVSGGAPISRELLEFFHAMGILILEGYGLTETSAPATVNHPDDFRFGTVGKPLKGVGIKIAPDGEILINGPGLFREYYKEPAATREAIDEEGWFHSGDIGELDVDGFLRITDRKKDLIITAAGKNVAPQNIENLIKTDRHISQVMVHGDRRNYLVALVTLDADELAAWAKSNGKAGAGLEKLARDPAVQELVAKIIDEKNAQLARYETVKKFRVLAEDFTVDNGMLTPTMKVKRRVIEKRYQSLLDEMYQEGG